MPEMMDLLCICISLFLVHHRLGPTVIFSGNHLTKKMQSIKSKFNFCSLVKQFGDFTRERWCDLAANRVARLDMFASCWSV